jgi:hypothetical protein
MRRLSQLWEWLVPGLIYLDPMGAMAFYQAIDVAPHPRAPAQRHLSEPLSVLVKIEQIEAPMPVRVGS